MPTFEGAPRATTIWLQPTSRKHHGIIMRKRGISPHVQKQKLREDRKDLFSNCSTAKSTAAVSQCQSTSGTLTTESLWKGEGGGRLCSTSLSCRVERAGDKHSRRHPWVLTSSLEPRGMFWFPQATEPKTLRSSARLRAGARPPPSPVTSLFLPTSVMLLLFFRVDFAFGEWISTLQPCEFKRIMGGEQEHIHSLQWSPL